MNEIEEIKKRMNKRRMKKNKKVLTDFHFLKFYNLMIKCMVLMLVIIAVFTYLRITPNGEYIREHIFSKFHYDQFVTWLNQQLYEFEPLENNINVSSQTGYKHLKDNLYTNNSNEVINFSRGRVIYTGNQELLGNYVTVLLENNIEVTFGQMTDIFVSRFDQVDDATILGTCEGDVLIIFTQGEKEIDYDSFKKILKEN